MYRRYEDPYALEKQLAEAKAEYAQAVANGADDEVLIDMSMDINELEERVNHAWQDDEFECEGGNW